MRKLAVVLNLSVCLIIASCSKSKFDGDSSKQNARIEPKPEPALKPDPNPDPIIVNCAKSPEKIKVISQTLVFEERKDCRFRSEEEVKNNPDPNNPNIYREEAYLNASESTALEINLPQGTICEMNLKSPETAQLHYDDFLILSLEKHMLFMTNNGFLNYLEKKNEIYTWDFSRVVGKPVANFEASPYCLGETDSCILPGHDEKGPVNINLSTQKIAPISAALMGKSKAELRLTATGDNDDEDCFHTRLELTVDIKYLPK